MSGTRQQWSDMINQLIDLLYQKNECYNKMPFNKALPIILQDLDDWRMCEVNHFIKENCPDDQDTQSMVTIHGAGVATCDCQC